MHYRIHFSTMQPFLSWRHFLQFVMGVVLILAAVYPVSTHAQSGSNPANCEEIADPDIKFQMEVCSSHVGCRLVMGIHGACVKVKQFLGNLKSILTREEKVEQEKLSQDTSIFGKLKSITGGTRVELTANHVVEASLTDPMKRLQDEDAEWRSKSTQVSAKISAANKQVLTGTTGGGTGQYAYIGDVTNGVASGWGTRFYSNGLILRGEFKDNDLSGTGDAIYSNGLRQLGSYVSGQVNGEGFQVDALGNQFRGTYRNGQANGMGTLYRPDGSIQSKGEFVNSKLHVGEIYSADGATRQTVDKPAEARLAQEQAEERQRERVLAQRAAAKRKEDEAAAAEQAYRASLNSLNAGELFAKADEWSSSGDKAKAREVLRALVSRFPDHPLAAQAAQQMSSGSASTTSSGSNASQAGGGACWDVLAKKEKEYEAINRKPMPQGATPPLMRVMWMTSDSMKIIDTHCPGDAKAAKYRAELQQSFNQAKTACEQMSIGGCTSNPYDGSAGQDDAQAAARRAQERREAAEAELERLAEQKRVQDLQNLSNALTNLANTLDKRKRGAAGGGGDCPPGLNLVNGQCRRGVAQ